MNTKTPSLESIKEAHKKIASYIHYTPLLTSESINQMTNAEVYFKCENFQKVGAFKARGAMNAVLSLQKEELLKGVCTHSSGNHAQALALAARENGSKAFIVMPRTSPKVKKDAVIGYGAKVIECEPTLEAREATVEQVIQQTGAVFIHPYNNYDVIAGQATAAKEIVEELQGSSLDYLLTPVGGGGLLSGTALAAHFLSPTTKVIGCEPKGADDAYQSFIKKRFIPSRNPKTIADGLLTSLGDKTFEIILKHVDQILTVSDTQILEALYLTWERMKIVIEPSSAVCLAAVLNNKELFHGKRVGIILSGGNVDIRSWTKQ